MAEISGNRLSELCGMSWRTIRRRLAAAGIKPARIDGSAHLFDSVRALQAIYAPAQIGEKLDLTQEKAALARVQRERQRLELDARRRELVPADEIANWFGSHIDRCCIRLDQIPDALGQRCDSITAARVVPECRRLIHDARAELAVDEAPDTG
jgi:phage terminase Nu1 subunit (DNA packaging protein)